MPGTASRHLDLIPSVSWHFQISQQKRICERPFSESAADVLNGILQLFFFLLLYIVDEKGCLLRRTLRYEIKDTDDDNSHIVAPLVGNSYSSY